jgi:hypothetical protein
LALNKKKEAKIEIRNNKIVSNFETFATGK